MLIIEKDKIKLTRGDNAYIELNISNYAPSEEDKVRFSVKEKWDDEEYVFQIVVNGGEEIAIIPEDTKDLECKKYVYDIELTTAAGEVFTIVGPASFYVMEEVTNG